MARVASLSQAAAVARLPVGELVNRLRTAVGHPEFRESRTASDEEYFTVQPDWVDLKRVVVTVDNGPEFAGRALDAWAYAHGVTLRFIRPGKPIENAFVESFNGKFRDECLNEHWFVSLADAQATIETWRVDYNVVRPHSALDGQTPWQFARASTGARGPRPARSNRAHNREGLSLSV